MSTRKRSVAALMVAFPLSVSFVRPRADARIASTSALRRRIACELWPFGQLSGFFATRSLPAPQPARAKHRTNGRSFRIQPRVAFARMLETLTVDDFRPLLDDRFRIAPEGAQAFEVDLVEITDTPREPGGRTPFSLVFAGGPDPPLPQAI